MKGREERISCERRRRRAREFIILDFYFGPTLGLPLKFLPTPTNPSDGEKYFGITLPTPTYPSDGEKVVGEVKNSIEVPI